MIDLSNFNWGWMDDPTDVYQIINEEINKPIGQYHKDSIIQEIFHDKLYEKLFGGFEDLSATAEEDENEIDELANIPKEKKTKQGYLKDGFVVDSSDTEEAEEDEDEEDEDEENEESTEEEVDVKEEDIGSELSEESYDYDSDTNNKK